MSCFACLSANRTLSSLNPYKDICAKLLKNSIQNIKLLQVCWECEARLRNIRCFQKQVEEAERMQTTYCISTKKQVPTLSRLTVCEQNLIIKIKSGTELKPEDIIPTIEPKIKIETNIENLKQEIISDNEIMYDDLVEDVPLEELFGKVIKKETKQKTKKTKPICMNKLWDLKKPVRVKLSVDRVKEYLEKERTQPFLNLCSFKCEDCAIGYLNKKSWEKHRHNKHNEKNQHACEICRRTFPTLHKAYIHKYTHNFIWKCRDCGYHSCNMNNMLFHLEQEHMKMEESRSCEYCVTKFRSNKLLQNHISNFHREFICDDCGHVSNTKKKILMHITSIHGPTHCDICDKTFKNHRNYKMHVKILHTVKHDESSYCVQCDIQFDNALLFKRHVNSSVKHKVEVRGDVPKKTYPCSECGKVYLQRYGMRNHYRLVHLKSTKYYCEECDLYLLNRTTFLRHHNKHRGIQLVRNKFCDICGRGFHTNRILINHIRTHTGERPHECPHCDAKFAQETALKSHIKHIHLKVERRRQFLA